MPVLISTPFHKFRVLPKDEALEGADLRGDTGQYLARFLNAEAKHVGREIKIHELSPERGAVGIIEAARILKEFERTNHRPAGLLETLSLLKHNLHLPVLGMEIPILGIRSDIDPRCILVTCTEPNRVGIEALPRPTSFMAQTWEAHDRLRFLGVMAN